MTNWKYILIVVILTAMVGVGVLYQWQALKEEAKISEIETPEKATETSKEEKEIVEGETADWKTYRNEEYKFEFQYPGMLDNLQISDDDSCEIKKEGQTFFIGDKIELQIFDSQGLALDDYYAQFREKLSNIQSSGVDYIGGVKAFSITYFLNKVWTKTYILLYDGEIYKFNYRSISSICDYGSDDAVPFNKLVSSFKFGDEIFRTIEVFCKKYNPPYEYKKITYINTDDDTDKEFVGLCQREAIVNDAPSPNDIMYLLFILDKQGDNYIPTMEIQGGEHQRFYKFSDFEIKDLDKDGIDEIITEEKGWYMGGGSTKIYLYSPKYKEWFWVNLTESCFLTEESEVEVTFSENLAEEHKVFKDFLSGEQEKITRQCGV